MAQSNDEVMDAADFYPNNSLCHGEYDGDGAQCHAQYLHEWKNTYDGWRFVYFYKSAGRKILRWDMQTERFIEPLILAENTDAAESLIEVEYSSAHRRLYLAHSSGRIDYFSDSDGVTQTAFLGPIGYPRIMSVVGPYLFVVEMPSTESVAWQNVLMINRKVEVLDSSGTIIASTSGPYIYEYKLDAMQDIVYAGAAASTFDMQALAFVPQANGLLSPPLAASADGTLSLRENGEIYDQTFSTPLGRMPFSVPGSFNPAIWLDRNILYLSSSYLYLYDSSGNERSYRELSRNISNILGLYVADTKAVAILYEGSLKSTRFYRIDGLLE